MPRQFLRHFVDVLDLAAEYADFDPMTAEGIELTQLTEDEQRLRAGHEYYDAEPEDEVGYASVEF